MKITNYFNCRVSWTVYGPFILVLLIAFAIPFVMYFKKEHEPPTIRVTINNYTFVAELADTAPKRELGLMFRQELAPKHGMLFLFDRPAVRKFWMRNTYIPLDIIFIDADRKIINVATMPARTDRTCQSQRGALYVLELKAGSAETFGLTPGMTVEFNLPARRSAKP